MIGLLALIAVIAGAAAGGIGLYGVKEFRELYNIGGEIFLAGAACGLAGALLGVIGKKISGKLLSVIAIVLGIAVLMACAALFFVYDGVDFFKGDWESMTNSLIDQYLPGLPH